jgi:hypothetical protein
MPDLPDRSGAVSRMRHFRPDFAESDLLTVAIGYHRSARIEQKRATFGLFWPDGAFATRRNITATYDRLADQKPAIQATF